MKVLAFSASCSANSAKAFSAFCTIFNAFSLFSGGRDTILSMKASAWSAGTFILIKNDFLSSSVNEAVSILYFLASIIILYQIYRFEARGRGEFLAWSGVGFRKSRKYFYRLGLTG